MPASRAIGRRTGTVFAFELHMLSCPSSDAQSLRARAKLTKNVRRLTLGSALLLSACSAPAESEGSPGAAGAPSATFCQAPAGVSGSPRTIEEAVTLLNALPKP